MNQNEPRIEANGLASAAKKRRRWNKIFENRTAMLRWLEKTGGEVTYEREMDPNELGLRPTRMR